MLRLGSHGCCCYQDASFLPIYMWLPESLAKVAKDTTIIKAYYPLPNLESRVKQHHLSTQSKDPVAVVAAAIKLFLPQ